MKLRVLVGAGDRVMGLTLPFVVVGLAANILRPASFAMGSGVTGLGAGIILLAIGTPLWLTSVVQILVNDSKGALITTGPFALMLRPLYTSVALLVLPGLGLLLDTWLGPALGAILYASSRLFSRSEERVLAESFRDEYAAYGASVLLPWL